MCINLIKIEWNGFIYGWHTHIYIYISNTANGNFMGNVLI